MDERAAAIQWLGDEFRRHLELFYAKLQLAPPYHSVEKAVSELTRTLRALPPEEPRLVQSDPARQWQLYRQAFVESGLSRKHRGIITEMVRSGKIADLPSLYKVFLEPFDSPLKSV
jgi:hypothetical protein